MQADACSSQKFREVVAVVCSCCVLLVLLARFGVSYWWGSFTAGIIVGRRTLLAEGQQDPHCSKVNDNKIW